MADTGDKLDSLRPTRFEGERIVIALAISVLAHALIWGGYELSRSLHLPPRLKWLALARQLQAIRQQPRYEAPLEFVTVDNPSPEAPPKDTKYYSNKNSVAANPNANKNGENPLLTGRQTDIPMTEDIRRQVSSKAESPSEITRHQLDNAPPKPEPKPSGDLTLGKPTLPQPEPIRPRTLKQAYEEMKKQVPELTMREDGGVQRRDEVSSFDVRLTGFGDYDAQFIDAVRQNWFNLLDAHKFSEDRTGKVVLLFKLNYDGSISQMRVAGNTVGDLLGYVCEKAILDGAPYAPWTEDMRLKLGDSRDMEFTFVYQ